MEIGGRMKTLSLHATSSDGEKLWSLSASSATGSVGDSGGYGQLSDVEVVLFDEDQPLVTVTADSGDAEETNRVFRLRGNVRAVSSDGRVSLRCDRISGSQKKGELVAEDIREANVNGMRIGPSKKGVALFASESNMKASSTALVLASLLVTGQDIWFETDEIKVVGVTKGSLKMQEGGKNRLLVVEGSPVIATWKQRGVTVQGKKLDTVLGSTDGSEQYGLLEGKFTGGIRVEMTGSERTANQLANWKMVLASREAEFSAQTQRLVASGGVSVDSSHPSAPGKFSSDTATIEFMKAESGGRTDYSPQTMSADGKNVTYEYSEGDHEYSLTNATHVEMTYVSTAYDRLTARGAPMRFTSRNPKEKSKFVVACPNFAADGKRTVQDGKKVYVLSSWQMSGGVRITVEGEAEDEKGQPKPWTLNIDCPTASFNESMSELKLKGGVTISGSHPVLGPGGAKAFAPQVTLGFSPDTYELRSVEFSGGAQRR